jgi:hypothetical protein
MTYFSKFPICGSDFITEELKNKLRDGLAQLEEFKDDLESTYETEESSNDELMQRILDATEVFLTSYVEPRNEVRLNGFIELWEKNPKFLGGLYTDIIDGLKIRKDELENEKDYEIIPIEEIEEEENVDENNFAYSEPKTLKSIDIASALLFSQTFAKTTEKLIDNKTKLANILIYSHRFNKLARG